jgi:uncharacterized protein YidB (DUF937 family)
MMGLLNQLLERIGGGALSSEHHNALLDIVMGVLANPQTGGLQGLLQKFQEKGLGEIASSWVGKGQNHPISPSQVQDVVGEDRIQEIAQKLGIDPARISESLSKLLPEVVDKMTPEGSVPPETPSEDQLGALKKMLGL